MLDLQFCKAKNAIYVYFYVKKMRTCFFQILSVSCWFLLNNMTSFAQGVAINGSGAAPDSSAILDVSSTTQGFLLPRMSTAQRDAIVNPALGLTIFNTTVNCLQWWNGTVWFDGCGNNVPAVPTYPAGTVHCGGVATLIVDITNPTTGKTWMDRNLGASQVAVNSTDVNSYGDLYQWGRRADGHQCRNSSTTNTQSSSDQPSHGNFILSTISPFDWRSPQNTNLWQGVNGLNNPCPSGYRIPTEIEFEAERLSWSSYNAAGAFASPLKLPMAGFRGGSNGVLNNVGTNGTCWTSTVSSANSRSIFFLSSNAFMGTDHRAYGLSVRCIKN